MMQIEQLLEVHAEISDQEAETALLFCDDRFQSFTYLCISFFPLFDDSEPLS